MKNLALILFLFFLSIVTITAQERGKASYYADMFHGRTTANGEIYDKNDITAAHKTLPFGTIVRVTRLDNRKSIEIRINDRGPYVKGRIIDLSERAAEILELKEDGITEVELEIIGQTSRRF